RQLNSIITMNMWIIHAEGFDAQIGEIDNRGLIIEVNPAQFLGKEFCHCLGVKFWCDSLSSGFSKIAERILRHRSVVIVGTIGKNAGHSSQRRKGAFQSG